MIWLAPQTPQEAADNVDAAHADHQDGCGCVERMRAALEGREDPEGVAYQYPVLHYGCAEATRHGCMTVIEAMTERIAEQMYAARVRDEHLLMGLSGALRG